VWEAEQQLACETMVTAFTTTPVLRHFNHDTEEIIETDGSDYVSAGVSSYPDDGGVLPLVADFLDKHSLAECNNDIYEMELKPIFKGLEEWRPEGEGPAYRFKLRTDHKNIQ